MVNQCHIGSADCFIQCGTCLDGIALGQCWSIHRHADDGSPWIRFGMA